MIKVVAVRIEDTAEGPVMTLYGRRLKNREVLHRVNIKGKTRAEVVAITLSVEGGLPAPPEG